MSQYLRGSDVLYLTQWDKIKDKISIRFKCLIIFYRLIFRFLIPFTGKYFVDNLQLKYDLIKKYKIDRNRFIYLSHHPEKMTIAKRPHKTFNILFYMPNLSTKNNPNLIRWIYGYWELLKIDAALGDYCDIKIIYYDGQKDFWNCIELTDFYIRPNNWDGGSTLVRLCEKNNIPFYHSKRGICEPEAIESILYYYHRWKNEK